MKLKVSLITLVFLLAGSSLIGCSATEKNVMNNESKEVILVKENKDNEDKVDNKEEKKEEKKVEIKEEKFQKYLNPRFGYSLNYPDKFKITKESDNGDGVELSFEDGKIIVYGSNNVLQETAKSLYEEDLKEIHKKDIMESSIVKETYIIRWKEGNFIKYKKSVVGEESINSFEVIYTLSKEKEFNDIVIKLRESFKTPNVDKMG